MKPASVIAITDAIKRCEKHLNITHSWGTDIESYLTKFLLVLICGEYEKEIERMINERAKNMGDEQVASFIAHLIHPMKWLRISELRGDILGRFCEKYKSDFDAKLSRTDAVQYYTNIVNNRMESAHGGTVYMTFKELKQTYKKADKVFTAFSQVLKVKRI